MISDPKCVQNNVYGTFQNIIIFILSNFCELLFHFFTFLGVDFIESLGLVTVQSWPGKDKDKMNDWLFLGTVTVKFDK